MLLCLTANVIFLFVGASCSRESTKRNEPNQLLWYTLALLFSLPFKILTVIKLQTFLEYEFTTIPFGNRNQQWEDLFNAFTSHTGIDTAGAIPPITSLLREKQNLMKTCGDDGNFRVRTYFAGDMAGLVSVDIKRYSSSTTEQEAAQQPYGCAKDFQRYCSWMVLHGKEEIY
jgi:hypothetical protein